VSTNRSLGAPWRERDALGRFLFVAGGSARWAVAAAVQSGMANLSLVYGLRLLPEGELERVGSGSITLKNGREEHVTLHLLEGSKEEIEAQLKQSIDAFFDIYPEIQ
jgi:hypothetical protein